MALRLWSLAAGNAQEIDLYLYFRFRKAQWL